MHHVREIEIGIEARAGAEALGETREQRDVGVARHHVEARRRLLRVVAVEHDRADERHVLGVALGCRRAQRP